MKEEVGPLGGTAGRWKGTLSARWGKVMGGKLRLQALVYDILPWRRVPESDARSVISTRTARKALTASLDSCAEIKSAMTLHSPLLNGSQTSHWQGAILVPKSRLARGNDLLIIELEQTKLVHLYR